MCSPYPQLKGPHLGGSQFNGLCQKRGRPNPQRQGPHRSVRVNIPKTGCPKSVAVHIADSRGPPAVLESESPTQAATQRCGRPYPKLKGGHR